jgi:quercetin 2,3-dioxygenase
MSQQRGISRAFDVPPLTPGFVGPGHLAASVVSAENFEMTDPFILLMDDHLDIGNRSVGGPHPHAGFETVTLILDGAIYDRDEGGALNAGEVQWMTAGSGVIHNEDVRTKGKMRLLQLWLTLPKKERWTEPGFQVIHSDSIPVRHESGAEIRVYSGSSGSLHSGTRNYVPVTMVEINLESGASAEQEVPASYNGFAFVIGGSDRRDQAEHGSGGLARSSDWQRCERHTCGRWRIGSATDLVRGTASRRPDRFLRSIYWRHEARHCPTLCRVSGRTVSSA